MVVVDTIFEAGRGPDGLNPPEQADIDERAECVVDRLPGDCADLLPDVNGNSVGGGMWMTLHGPQDCEPLSGDLDAAFPKDAGRVGEHDVRLGRSLD